MFFKIVQNDLREHCHDDGHHYIQRLSDLNDPLDSALISRNKTRTIEILRGSVSIVYKMLPYIKSKKHYEMFTSVNSECEKLCDGKAELYDIIRFGIRSLLSITRALGVPLPFPH